MYQEQKYRKMRENKTEVKSASVFLLLFYDFWHITNEVQFICLLKIVKNNISSEINASKLSSIQTSVKVQYKHNFYHRKADLYYKTAIKLSGVCPKTSRNRGFEKGYFFDPATKT